MTNHKILLVDDDRDVLEMLLSIFQRGRIYEFANRCIGS